MLEEHSQANLAAGDFTARNTTHSKHYHVNSLCLSVVHCRICAAGTCPKASCLGRHRSNPQLQTPETVKVSACHTTPVDNSQTCGKKLPSMISVAAAGEAPVEEEEEEEEEAAPFKQLPASSTAPPCSEVPNKISKSS
jgi:hypothetical protein